MKGSECRLAKTIDIGFISDKINGIAVDSTLKCNSTNYENMTNRRISYIVMHYTGNAKDTAKANANYFTGSNRQASAHFFVDDESIYQSVELRDKAWHCGTSGIYYHSTCRNTNSIGIEMCCTAGNYKISDATIKNSAYLCAYLCKKIGITADQVDMYVLRHYDVTHKSCPAQMVKNTVEWSAFKTLVKNILKSNENESKVEPKKNPKEIFINDTQKILGVKVTGVADKKTLSKTITVSVKKNSKHAIVKVIQLYLNELGYDCGVADGIAGQKFTSAVKSYQKDNKCTVDGEITAKGKTWKKLLGLA